MEDIKNMSTLCYMEKEGSYLMLHRTVKKNDVNKDKWIGVGGHFKRGESPEECVLREVKEETGYTLTSFRYRGIVTFLCGDEGLEYMSLFTADGFTGEPIPCNEGELEWVPIERVWKLELWEGDKIFFRLLEEEEPFFSLKLVYDVRGRLLQAALNGRPMELFDILNEDGTKSGIVKERGVAHREGSLHPTVHTWIAREKEKGRYEVLLQKRSADKDSYPGCYDISSAGHVACGDSYPETAVREMQEELGLFVRAQDLEEVGLHRGRAEAIFRGKPFRDNEISQVYLYRGPVETDRLILQEAEVEEVIWMDYEECLRIVMDRSVPNCIFEDEFRMLGEYLGYEMR